MSTYNAKDDYQQILAGILKERFPVAEAHVMENLAGSQVDALSRAGLLPIDREYRRGHPTRYLKKAYEKPPELNEDEYLLTRLVTPWRGRQA